MTESTGGGQHPVADAALVLFPPPNPKSEQYALAPNSIRFGWDSAAGAGEGRFLVSKYRWTGGTTVVAEWPLSAEGWEAAWRYLLTEQPQLATAVQTVGPEVPKRDPQPNAGPRTKPSSTLKGGSIS
jgi:hypothetical protein